MKVFLLLLILFSASSSRGQNEKAVLDSAQKSFCDGDTIKTIRYLKIYTQTYPDTNINPFVHLCLGKLYVATNQYESALNILSIALNSSYANYYPAEKITACKQLFPISLISPIKANICVELSQAYKKINDTAKEFEYLNLADTKYFPKYDCANGLFQYKNYLTIFISDYYLRIGDTTKAVNRLLDFMLYGENYSLEIAQKLKEILQSKYSKKHIRDNINKSIAELTKRKRINSDNTETFDFDLFIFSHKVYWYPPYETLKANRNYLRKNIFLNILKT